MLHGKCPEVAKRKALGMGISPRALGRAATARADLGTWRARTGNFLEWRQRATSSSGGSFWRSCDEKEGARWMRWCRSGVTPMDRKWWRRRQLTGTERKGCDDSAMGGSSSRWEGRLAVPRFIEREGHGNIAAAPVISAHGRAEHGRQFRSLLQQRGRPYFGSMSTSRCCCCRVGLGPGEKI